MVEIAGSTNDAKGGKNKNNITLSSLIKGLKETYTQYLAGYEKQDYTNAKIVQEWEERVRSAEKKRDIVKNAFENLFSKDRPEAKKGFLSGILKSEEQKGKEFLYQQYGQELENYEKAINCINDELKKYTGVNEKKQQIEQQPLEPEIKEGGQNLQERVETKNKTEPSQEDLHFKYLKKRERKEKEKYFTTAGKEDIIVKPYETIDNLVTGVEKSSLKLRYWEWIGGEKEYEERPLEYFKEKAGQEQVKTQQREEKQKEQTTPDAPEGVKPEGAVLQQKTPYFLVVDGVETPFTDATELIENYLKNVTEVSSREKIFMKYLDTDGEYKRADFPSKVPRQNKS